ncbi:hypothetical protein BGW38_003175 [Lunasporangiospora selenospora]|uniref:DUF7719 domain-containing protein n=1 Tax=Lunasporangiospora selenospora TaxID=979761 RepID=A0A9P6KCW1_9FUNG|nr:hypothetical protein BGW38_003175 [Lunasporangiospora selenospora]
MPDSTRISSTGRSTATLPEELGSLRKRRDGSDTNQSHVDSSPIDDDLDQAHTDDNESEEEDLEEEEDQLLSDSELDSESDTDSDSSGPGEEISGPEQWRIIRESGIMEKLNEREGNSPTMTKRQGKRRNAAASSEQEEVKRDYIFEGIFLSIPMTCLFVVMDVLVHRQYGETYGGGDVFRKVIKIYPAILIMIYLSNKAKSSNVMQAAMFIVSTFSGCYFLHTMFRSPAMGIMLRAPGVVTILVYCIVQLNLLPAVISLALCGLYYKFGNVKYSH